ncbi:hypothetical protein L6452_31038 [Arctium lappa]|uniref:Uncharacterized protein n=1 Tax=Arctium lappa TaxID=4217 RepID=A0ACB8ZJY3_ARCLA|nr:hypothetical protein L6452_31038 [Arctium lappa]
MFPRQCDTLHRLLCPTPFDASFFLVVSGHPTLLLVILCPSPTTENHLLNSYLHRPKTLLTGILLKNRGVAVWEMRKGFYRCGGMENRLEISIVRDEDD